MAVVMVLVLSQDALLKALASDKRLYGECPSCEVSFPLAKAQLFYGEPISGSGLDAFERWKEQLASGREELSNQKKKAKERSTRAVFSVNIGKYLEKIAPVLPGFSYDCHDCRGLFDPIDYIVFEGLTKKNRVESIQVIDIKTGGSPLNEHQEQIKDAIEKKRVEWQTYRK
jgi:predicted Holliday junction resolvase-like endonuclease